MPDDQGLLRRGDELANRNSVFVHIRRNNYTPLLDVQYYQNAITAALCEIESPSFVLFGDDIQWALSSLDFGSAPVESQSYDQTDELVDLWLMSRCRHAIIANSTFSWWGAWLGSQVGTNRMVWAPASTGLPLVNAPSWVGIPAQLAHLAGR